VDAPPSRAAFTPPSCVGLLPVEPASNVAPPPASCAGAGPASCHGTLLGGPASVLPTAPGVAASLKAPFPPGFPVEGEAASSSALSSSQADESPAAELRMRISTFFRIGPPGRFASRIGAPTLCRKRSGSAHFRCVVCWPGVCAALHVRVQALQGNCLSVSGQLGPSSRATFAGICSASCRSSA
jgi:hypothetical protein